MAKLLLLLCAVLAGGLCTRPTFVTSPSILSETCEKCFEDAGIQSEEDCTKFKATEFIDCFRATGTSAAVCPFKSEVLFQVEKKYCTELQNVNVLCEACIKDMVYGTDAAGNVQLWCKFFGEKCKEKGECYKGDPDMDWKTDEIVQKICLIKKTEEMEKPANVLCEECIKDLLRGTAVARTEPLCNYFGGQCKEKGECFNGDPDQKKKTDDIVKNVCIEPGTPGQLHPDTGTTTPTNVIN